MLNRTSHHPQRRERDPNPTSLSSPSQANSNSAAEARRRWKGTMTLRTPRNQIQHPKDAIFLVKTTRWTHTHHAKPRPNNVKSRINTNRPIKKVKKGRSIGKRHLRGPNRSNNSSPKRANRRGGDTRSFSRMETGRKILTTNKPWNPRGKAPAAATPIVASPTLLERAPAPSPPGEIKMTTKIPDNQLNLPKATIPRNVPKRHSLPN